MRPIPNILTVFRLVSPLFVLAALMLLARPFADWVGLSIFVVAALTDFLDGYLARWFNSFSQLGRILDPIADKVLVLSTGAILLIDHAAVTNLINPMILIPFILIMIREFTIGGVREVLAGKVALPVSWVAKVKTTMQLLAVILLFFQPITGFRVGELTQGMDNIILQGIVAGAVEDEIGLLNAIWRANAVDVAVVIAFWVAAILAWVSGLGYLSTAIRSLKKAAT